jgi:signal transduction histidine kinase
MARLSAALSSQRAFVADAAHELRTPLAGLTAALEVARDYPETADRGTLVPELLDGHRRLGRLVNDLLVLASLDGQVPLRRRPVELDGVVADCTRRSVPDGVCLRAGPSKRAVVLGDEAQIERMLTNLVDNALRYARTTVEVGLTVEDGEAVIAVEDDGPGVAPADRQRVWERFVRLDGDRSRSSGGTGLGLALVRELARAHGGGVAIADPASGRGSVFVVRLPLLGSRTDAEDMILA